MKTLIAVLCVLVMTAITVSCGNTYSEGFRSGTLIKFSKKGSNCKTYEGQLNMAVSSNEQANLWAFSYEGDDGTLIKKANSLAGKKVIVTYKQVKVKPGLLCSPETEYLLTDIKAAE
jgi:hypothetical protein